MDSTKFNSFNVIDRFKGLEPQEVKKLIKRNKFRIAGLNLEYPYNVASMMRISNGFAAEEFVVIGSKKYDRRASVGTHWYENVRFIKTLNEFYTYVRENKLCPIGIDYRKGSTIDTTLIEEWPKNPIFIFGNEGSGLPDELYNFCDLKAHVGMYGSVRSFNVATVCAMICYDWRVKTLAKAKIE